jgi:hypothetical protein
MNTAARLRAWSLIGRWRIVRAPPRLGRGRRSSWNRRRRRREASGLPWSCVRFLGVRDVGLGDGAEQLRTRGCFAGRRIPSSERRSPVLLFGRCLVAPLPSRPLQWLDLAEGSASASIAYAATPPGEFLPLGCAHSSRGKKLARLASFALLRPASGCVVDRLRLFDHH